MDGWSTIDPMFALREGQKELHCVRKHVTGTARGGWEWYQAGKGYVVRCTV